MTSYPSRKKTSECKPKMIQIFNLPQWNTVLIHKDTHLNCISDVMKLFSAYHETIGSKVGVGTFWEIRNVLVLKFENTSKTELCLNLASNN